MPLLPILAFAGQVRSEPQVTLGELRRLVPTDLRPAAIPPNPGWAIAVAASKERPLRPSSRQGAGLPATGGSSQPQESAQDLLPYWQKTPDRTLLRRSKVVLERYGTRMARMRKALAYPVWSLPRLPDRLIPAPSDSPPLPFSELAGMEEIVSAFLLGAYVDLWQRQYPSAERDLGDAWSIANHTCAMPGSIIGYAVGMSEAELVYSNVLHMATSGRLPTPIIARFSRTLARVPARAQFAANLRSELDFSLWFIAFMPDPDAVLAERDRRDDQIRELLRTHPHPYSRTQTVRWFSEAYRDEIANLGRPWKSQVDVESKVRSIYDGLPAVMRSNSGGDATRPTQAELDKASLTLLTIDNPLGRFLFEVAVGIVFSIPESAFLSEARLRAHALAFATIVYKRRTGGWPSSLAKLTGRDGVSGTLLDPFTGLPYRYDARKRTISSPGPGGVGSGNSAIRIALGP